MLTNDQSKKRNEVWNKLDSKKSMLKHFKCFITDDNLN